QRAVVNRARARCGGWGGRADPLPFVAGSTPLPCWGSPARLLQGELLHPPVHELGDIQGVRIAAVDRVDHPELFHLLASAADTADDRPVQLHLVNLAVE